MRSSIQVIVDKFYPVLGGMEFDILTIHDRLKSDWDISVFCSRSTFTEQNSLQIVDKYNNIKIFRSNSYGDSFFPKLTFSENNIIHLNNFNIFPHFLVMLRVAVHRLLNLKRPIILLTPYTGFNPIWENFGLVSRIIKKFYHYTIGKYLLNYTVNEVRAISEWEEKILVDSGVTVKIRVIKCGLEDEAYKNLYEPSQKIKNFVASNKYIIQIGRIHKIKNYETSIRALGCANDKTLKLAIVGPDHDKEYKDKLITLIDELNLNGRVVFLGVVTVDDKYFLLKHAQMLIHTSLYEGFGLAPYEAMSQGLVCIIAKYTALDELVVDGENGFLVEPKDHKQFAKIIDSVLALENKDKMNDIQSNNLKITRDSSWDNVAQQVEKWYGEYRNV